MKIINNVLMKMKGFSKVKAGNSYNWVKNSSEFGTKYRTTIKSNGSKVEQIKDMFTYSKSVTKKNGDVLYYTKNSDGTSAFYRNGELLKERTKYDITSDRRRAFVEKFHKAFSRKTSVLEDGSILKETFRKKTGELVSWLKKGHNGVTERGQISKGILGESRIVDQGDVITISGKLDDAFQLGHDSKKVIDLSQFPRVKTVTSETVHVKGKPVTNVQEDKFDVLGFSKEEYKALNLLSD